MTGVLVVFAALGALVILLMWLNAGGSPNTDNVPGGWRPGPGVSETPEQTAEREHRARRSEEGGA